jgi:hypothetical protein
MKKILLTGLGPISNKIHSHKAAQAIIYADQLSEAGMDVTVNLVSNKITDYTPYEEIYFYHGSDWSGNLNLFGGIEAYANTQFVSALSHFNGKIKSIIVDFPDYASMFLDRLQKKNMQWNNVHWENLRKLQGEAETIDPNTIKRYRNIAFGDSHAICMYRPGWENISVPFSTLHGSINRGFEEFIPEGGEYDNIETYFGNIDIRHHLCRFDNPVEEAKKLADRYGKEVDRIRALHKANVTAWEPLPIEDEARKIPKTGWYKGTPFFGKWQQRDEVRNAFTERLKSHTQVYEWTQPLLNPIGQLSYEAMEKPQSVHLSRESYPHWQGKKWTEKEEYGASLEAFFA